MKKSIAALAVTTTLLTSGFAYATDAGVIAAALPDEASECRYLAQLAERGRGIKNEMNFVLKPISEMTREEKLQRIADINELIARDAREYAAFDEALRVIRAQHTQMPPCFEAFADVYDLNSIR